MEILAIFLVVLSFVCYLGVFSLWVSGTLLTIKYEESFMNRRRLADVFAVVIFLDAFRWLVDIYITQLIFQYDFSFIAYPISPIDWWHFIFSLVGLVISGCFYLYNSSKRD